MADGRDAPWNVSPTASSLSAGTESLGDRLRDLPDSGHFSDGYLHVPRLRATSRGLSPPRRQPRKRDSGREPLRRGVPSRRNTSIAPVDVRARSRGSKPPTAVRTAAAPCSP